MARVSTVTTGERDNPTLHWNALITDYLSQTDTTAQALASSLTAAAGTTLTVPTLDVDTISERTAAAGVAIDVLASINKRAADPATAGWGDDEKGLMWHNTTEGKYKYWTGVAVVSFPVTGGAGAPTDASYVTINAEAGLDAETLHGTGITDPVYTHGPLNASYVIFTSGGTTYGRACGTGLANLSDADFATVFQDAVNALSSGMIFLKAGTYAAATTLTVNDNLTICGEGYGQTIIQATAALNPIMELTASGAHVRDLTLDGDSTAVDGLEVTAANCRVTRIEVTDPTANGIVLGDDANAYTGGRVDHCRLSDCPGYGIFVTDNFSDSHLTGNLCRGYQNVAGSAGIGLKEGTCFITENQDRKSVV